MVLNLKQTNEIMKKKKNVNLRYKNDYKVFFVTCMRSTSIYLALRSNNNKNNRQ